MGKFKKPMEVSSNIGGYSAMRKTDTGFIRGDKERVLGGLAWKLSNRGLKELVTNRLTFLMITFMVKVRMKMLMAKLLRKSDKQRLQENILIVGKTEFDDEDFEPQNTQINDSINTEKLNNLLLERIDI